MKNFVVPGLSILLVFVWPTGCQRNGTAKLAPAAEGPVHTKTETKTEIKKVVLPEPVKKITDYIIEKIKVESPRDIQQIVDLLPAELLPKITDININEKGSSIESLRGIEELQNLEYINVKNSKIRTVGDVKISDKIKFLFLGYSQISETSSFESLGQLNSLGLNGCPIKEVGDLSKLKNLVSLSLDDTNIAGLEGKKLPPKLRYLGLSGTKFKSLRAIESTFPFVDTIELSHGAIERVDDVADFGRVKQIGLSENPVMERFRDKDGNVPQTVNYKGVSLVFVDMGS